MKNLVSALTILFLFSIQFVLNSCTPRYGLANLGSQTKYLPKPAYGEEEEKATYLSGQFYQSTGYDTVRSLSTMYPIMSPVDMISYYGDFAYIKSSSAADHNTAYGMFVSGGNYKVKSLDEFNGNKYFLGAGLIGDINVNIPFKHVDWRIIGIKGAITYENGEYSKFRTLADREGLIIDIHPNNIAASMHLTSEVLGKINDINISFYNSFGLTYGRKNIFLVSQALQFTHQRTTVFLQPSYLIFINNINFSFSFGLNYKINSGLNRNEAFD